MNLLPLRLTLAGTAAVVLVLTPALAGAAPDRPGQPRYSEGADGAGDPYFPLAGNGGIDVLHYGLRRRWKVTWTGSRPSTCKRPRTCTGSTWTCAG